MVREVNVCVNVTKILQRQSLFYWDLKRRAPPFTSLCNFENWTRLQCYSDLFNVLKVWFNIEQNKKSNKAAANKVTVLEKSGQQKQTFGYSPWWASPKHTFIFGSWDLWKAQISWPIALTGFRLLASGLAWLLVRSGRTPRSWWEKLSEQISLISRIRTMVAVLPNSQGCVLLNEISVKMLCYIPKH